MSLTQTKQQKALTISGIGIVLQHSYTAFFGLLSPKWVERQNQHIAKQFTTIIRKIESLYRNDAVRQVEAAHRNVLADYGELFQLRNDVKTLTENNDSLKSILETMLDQLANPSIRSKIFAITDALIYGTPISVSSGGGGGNSSSDLH